MLGLEKQFILFDTEFTAWPGSQENGWNDPDQWREIVQIGAILLESGSLKEVGSLDLYIRPRRNPELSDYFIDLTGITQKRIEEEGVDFADAAKKFAEWCGARSVYSYGNDSIVLEENCILCGMQTPFTDVPFSDIRDTFRRYGIPVQEYSSGRIIEAFGVTPQRRPHNALNDVRNIADALRMLTMTQEGTT